MTLVDANVLIYAVNADSELHEPALRWLDDALNGTEAVGLDWVVLLAFIRLVTSRRIMPSPLSVAEATGIVDLWTKRPSTVLVTPGPRHLGLLSGLLGGIGSGGNLVSDAHLAALALDIDAAVATFDTDFGRFPGLRTIRPA